MQLKYVGLAIVGLGAVVLGYFLGRTQDLSIPASAVAAQLHVRELDTTSAQSGRGLQVPRGNGLSARGTPLKRVLPDLRERMDTGDLEAARRLYGDLWICSRLERMDRAFAGIADEVLAGDVGTGDANSLDAYRLQLDGIESRKRNTKKLHELCDGIDRDALDLQVPVLQKAAQLGDERARACYLDRGPTYDVAAMVRHPEWLQSYRANAASLIDAGLKAGDWKVVDILRSAYDPDANNPLSGVLGADPVMYYRYLKLYRLGAEPYRVEQIDSKLAAAAARIRPEQRVDADVWAQATLQQHFGADNSTESTIPGWDPCTFPYEPW